LSNCQECGLQLTLVRTATPAHFENGFWNTGGYCNRTEPMGGEAMTTTVEWAIRNVQVEEAIRAQNENSHKKTDEYRGFRYNQSYVHET